jgi:hypothetical protein
MILEKLGSLVLTWSDQVSFSVSMAGESKGDVPLITTVGTRRYVFDPADDRATNTLRTRSR